MFHFFNSSCSFVGHLSQPAQTFLNCWQAQNIEIVENLGMNLSLFQDNFGYFAVLSWRAFNQINYVIDSTIFQTVLLLFITAVHYRSRQIISCFSLNDEIKHVICKQRSFLCILFLLFLFIFSWLWH